MREMDYTDFETQNIETIEFWLMDPFIENPNHTGGKLYINLGDISEDILRDGRKSFENGLPTSPEVTGVDTTIWDEYPTLNLLSTLSITMNPRASIRTSVTMDLAAHTAVPTSRASSLNT